MIATAKTTQANIWNLATQAATPESVSNFIKSAQYPTSAVAIAAIQNAPDQQTALNIMTATGLGGKTGGTGTWSTPYTIASGDTVQKNTLTGEIKVIDSPAVVPKDAATTAAETTVTNTVNNIVDGNSSLTDLVSSTGVPDPNVQNIKAQLQTLGYYSDTPPSWYVKAQNDQAGQNVLPSIIQTNWTAARNKALGTSS